MTLQFNDQFKANDSFSIDISIGGAEWNSFIDFHDHISIVFFVNGCNLNCDYCHNKYLLTNKNRFNIRNVIENIEKRKKFAEGIVLCGGEPTLQKDIVKFAALIKNAGYLLKLDTNGTVTEKVKELCEFADYVALDVKTVFEKYSLTGATKKNIENIIETIEFLKNSNVKFEFRTTVFPDYVDLDELITLEEILKPKEFLWYLQTYQAAVPLDGEKRFDLLVKSKKIIGDFLNIRNYSGDRILVK